MGIEHRPYVGTWRLDQKGLVQHTPDSLVYINGDLSIPGCQKCSGRIDIQEFLTEVSVNAGVDPGSADASFTLSVPVHHTDSFARGGNHILQPGLEVHIYQRGYFPVKGLYQNLGEKALQATLVDDVESEILQAENTALQQDQQVAFEKYKARVGRFNYRMRRGAKIFGDAWNQKGLNPSGSEVDAFIRKYGVDAGRVSTARSIYTTVKLAGYSPAVALMAMHQAFWESRWNPKAKNYGGKTYRDENKANDTPVAIGVFQINNVGRSMGSSNPNFAGGKKAGSATQAQREPDKYYNAENLAINISRWLTAADKYGFMKNPNLSPAEVYDRMFWSPLAAGGRNKQFDQLLLNESQEASELDAPLDPDDLDAEDLAITQGPIPPSVLTESSPGVDLAGSTLEEQGLAGYNLEDLVAYPYYHVFHGVVTDVTSAYSQGVNTYTVNCRGMLHFWEYQVYAANGSVLGVRPANSGLDSSLVGHNATGQHPYQIMYSLYRDVVGAAAGVAWVLQQQTNQQAITATTGEELWSLVAKYWEKRFQTSPPRLRMHALSGELFSAAQAAFLSTLTTKSLSDMIRKRFVGAGVDPAESNYFEVGKTLGLFKKRKLDALAVPGVQTKPVDSNDTVELNAAEMAAFMVDLGTIGNVAIFESVYETKLDIANKVTQLVGFEFYQDVDGDFVFKPPMYNLDTSSSRVYRIEPIDIISISETETEPQATFATFKGSAIANVAGTGLEGEYGVQGQYIDHRLVAQFSWRGSPVETSYINTPQGMFLAAVNHVDLENVKSRTASITIPHRPEIRPGYPVYLTQEDCYYYVTQISHQTSFGSDSTTTLTCVGKREPFYAPGDHRKSGIGSIDLAKTSLPPKPLEILGDDMRPRLSGFPNVVMALDADQLAVSTGFADVAATLRPTSQEGLKRLLDLAVEHQILRKVTDTQYVMFVGQQGDSEDKTVAEMIPVLFEGFEPQAQARTPGDSEELVAGWTKAKVLGPTSKRVDIRNANDGARNGLAARSALDAALRKKELELARVRSDYTAGQALVAPGNQVNVSEKETARLRDLAARQAALQKEFDQLLADRRALDEKPLPPEQAEAVQYLNELLRQLGRAGRTPPNQEDTRKFDRWKYLDMLADKKALMTNGSQPGTYRYYSASHPFNFFQGPETLRYEYDRFSGRGVVSSEPANLSSEWQGKPVQGFLSTVTGSEMGFVPEAQLGFHTPVRGVRISTPDSQYPEGIVVPTSEIRELRWARHDVSQVTTATSNENSFKALSNSAAYSRWLNSLIEKTVDDSFEVTDSIANIYAPFFNSVEGKVGVAAIEAEKAALRLLIPSAQIPDFAFDVTEVVTSSAWSLEIQGTSVLGNEPYVPQATAASAFGLPPSPLGQPVRDALVQQVVTLLRVSLDRWVSEMSNRGVKPELITQVRGFFDSALLGSTFLPRAERSQTTQTVQAPKQVLETPVFPVSDARGYRVVGAFRYGRGVDIEPGGVWDSLHSQDPLSLVDPATVQAVVDQLIEGNLSAETSAEVLRQLRLSLSDRDLLNLGIIGQQGKMLTAGLRNWFASGKEGIHKLPVNNIGYSIAELKVGTDQHVCDCKIAEAHKILDTLNQTAFVTVDSVTDAVRELTASKVPGWQLAQDAVDGTRQRTPRRTND